MQKLIIAVVVAVIATTGGHVMAQDTTQNDELQQQIDRLKKEKELLDAQLALFKARLGEVSSSGLTGAVDTKENTGQIEGVLLAMRAVNEAGDTIAGRIRSALPAGGKVVVMSAAEAPTFSNLIAYDAEVSVIRHVLQGAIDAAPRPAVDRTTKAFPAIGAAGLVLDATSKLLSFFRTDYTVQGVLLTIEDSAALNAVAAALVRLPGNDPKRPFEVAAPMIYDPAAITEATGMFVEDISELAKLRGEAEDLLGRLQIDIAQAKDAAEKKGLVKGLEAAITLVDAWYTKLVTPDSKGLAGLVNVAREKALWKRIKGGTLLVVKVHKAGGGFMTKKNLWTLFGGMPLYHMGGAAVSFTLIDGTSGTVKTSGVVPVHGGFVKAGDLRKTIGS